MSEENSLSGLPQFGTAEYEPSGDRCKTCEQAIAGPYYRVSGAMTCPACAEKAVGELPKDTHKAFGRGVLFGLGGAFVGLVLYSTVGIVTGLAIGYVSLAVGYIVGKAMMKGSWGIGGRRYQIAAAALTYAAVSMSAIPVGISMLIQQGQGPQVKQVAPAETGTQPQAAESKTGEADEPQMGLGMALAYLALLGLASPFLELAEPFHGLIGLVILLVGIHIAWRITAGRELEILGPFQS